MLLIALRLLYSLSFTVFRQLGMYINASELHIYHQFKHTTHPYSRHKTWSIIGLHPLCALLFALGYALRAYSSAAHYLYSIPNLIIYIFSQVFIYVCPYVKNHFTPLPTNSSYHPRPLLELANYHVLGRTLSYVPKISPLPPSLVLRVFGSIMAIIEAVNSLGVSLSANPSSSPTTQNLGKYLTLTALSIQFVVLFTFVILAATFHHRCNRKGLRAPRIQPVLRTLYISTFLILVRCIYRLIEHLGNTNIDLDDMEALKHVSPILRYEVYFWIFEAVLMLFNSILWNIWNPGRELKRNVYLGSNGVTELEYEQVKDERNVWEKVGCVVTFGLLWKKETGNREFHELHDCAGTN